MCIWLKDEVTMDPKKFLLLMIAPIHFQGLKKFESSKCAFVHPEKTLNVDSVTMH